MSLEYRYIGSTYFWMDSQKLRKKGESKSSPLRSKMRPTVLSYSKPNLNAIRFINPLLKSRDVLSGNFSDSRVLGI